MKVLLPKDYKKYFTIEEYEIAKEIIKMEREDDASTAKDMAEYAVREALKNDDLCYLEEILEAKAEVCKNNYQTYEVYDRYFEGSQLMDIYISGVAKVSFGYLEFGAYLSDIWETGAREYKVDTVKYVKEEK